ncbi:uncharacterized protein LOC141589959 [Silene latifolia]|uniref:uncharacterized protein LOC141589959 n=1 Tax=Silene latifolia TaxID=37657 RepID=UPI003D777768
MNKVLEIEDMHEKQCLLGDDIQNAFLYYYQDLSGTTIITDHVNLSVVRRGLCCTADHWDILNRPVTVEEIKHIIFCIPKSKSPGPDGFNSQLYKDAWDIVGEEVCAAIANFFDTGQLVTQINSTVITLIPKVDRPTSVKHFRPISCCNVIYKSISKILCSRLPLVLPDIISRNQGAFVKGRSILENILICQDLVRLYFRAMASPKCMFKLDLQKAYDSIEWSFVEQMLVALNFPVNFRQMVMTCISTTSYSLNLNGGTVWGDVQSIMLMLRALATFSATSGLRVNAARSEVVFNSVAPGLKHDITEIYGFAKGVLPFKYLGIPIQAGRLTKTDCNVLIDKIVLRVRSIGARKLSYAGRLVLINSVFNTLHNYWASIFLIPKGVIKRIEAICGNYLWSGDTEYHRTHLVAWHDVCCSKKEGGLGIKDAGVWNVANVGKLVNWIYTKANRLWVLRIDHVYMKGVDWDSCQPPQDSNWNWRNICKVRGILSRGFQGNQWVADPKGYSIGAGYQWKALNTRVKLLQMGVTDNDNCVLCEGGPETHCHLFTDCIYNQQVIAGLENWLQRKLIVSPGCCSKLQYKVIKSIQKQVIGKC